MHVDLGHLLEHEGLIADALPHAQHALALCDGTEDHRARARALCSAGWYHALLGDPHHAVGNPAAARNAWEMSLSVLQEFGPIDVGHVRPEQLRGKLRDLDPPETAPPSAALE